MDNLIHSQENIAVSQIERVIPTIPFGTIIRPNSDVVDARLRGLVAYLLSESEGETIEPTEDIVVSKYDSLKALTKCVYGHMVMLMAKQDKTPVSEAIKLSWSSFPEELKDKHILKLEKNASRLYQLDIGRCKNRWGARALLQASTKHLTYVNSIQKYLDMISLSSHG